MHLFLNYLLYRSIKGAEASYSRTANWNSSDAIIFAGYFYWKSNNLWKIAHEWVRKLSRNIKVAQQAAL